MATTSHKVEKALEILKGQDWYWGMADYSTPAYRSAYSSMRVFVEIVASISDYTIIKAMRDLWTATYEYVHATMWSSNDKAKAEYESKKAQLMAIIKPQFEMAA